MIFFARAGSIKPKTDDLRHRAFYKTAVNTEDNAPEDDLDRPDQNADGDAELPSVADEAYDVICEMTGRTLALLYQVREDEPEATVDGQDVNTVITHLEGFLARVKATQQELVEVTRKRLECYAELCLEQNELPTPFWSFAATVGRYHYPAHPKIQLYYDTDDLQEYLKRQEPDPDHLLN